MQGKGIGRALIEAGLLTLRELGAEGCVLLGNPKFYERFGFRHRPECVLEGVPQEYFQSLTFGRHSAAGRVSYHEAFNAKG
jgi:putative acetyltransferase